MISSGVVSIGTVAIAIDGVSHNPVRIMIQNNDNTDTLYIGGTGVTPATGFYIQKLEHVQLDLAPLEQVYAVSTKTGHSVSYLRQVL